MLRVFLYCLLLSYSYTAVANAEFDVSPIRLELSADAPSGALTLRNRTDSPRLIEVTIMRWRRVDHQDNYNPSRAILANPPVFEVAPYASQIVRVGINTATATDTESSYRVYLTEVATGQRQQLQILLSVGIPVFIPPASGANYQLMWQASAVDDDNVELTVHNTGNSHVQLEPLQVYFPLTDEYEEVDSLEYRSHQRIFPQEFQRWRIPLASEHTEISLRYFSAQLSGEHTLPIQGR